MWAIPSWHYTAGLASGPAVRSYPEVLLELHTERRAKGRETKLINRTFSRVLLFCFAVLHTFMITNRRKYAVRSWFYSIFLHVFRQWMFTDSLLCRNTWTPTNASTSFSNSLRKSAEMSEGKRFLRLFGADVLLLQDISSCLQSIPNQRQQNNVVWFWVWDKLCTLFLRNAFCVGSTLKSGRQRGDSGPSVGLTGGISHGGPLQRICPGQWEWRAYGDANLMTLSPPCSYHLSPSSYALPP